MWVTFLLTCYLPNISVKWKLNKHGTICTIFGNKKVKMIKENTLISLGIAQCCKIQHEQA